MRLRIRKPHAMKSRIGTGPRVDAFDRHATTLIKPLQLGTCLRRTCPSGEQLFIIPPHEKTRVASDLGLPSQPRGNIRDRVPAASTRIYGRRFGAADGPPDRQYLLGDDRGRTDMPLCDPENLEAFPRC